MLDQSQINPNEFLYSGLGGGNHISFIDPTTLDYMYGWYCAACAIGAISRYR